MVRKDSDIDTIKNTIKFIHKNDIFECCFL